MPTARKTTPAKKAAAKKTAAAKKETVAAKETGAEGPPAQPTMAIADQAAFAQAIGLDPNTLMQNSLRIEFNQQGVAVVIYTAAMALTPQQLGYAFMASSGMLGGGAAGESTPVPADEPDEG